MMIYLNNTGLNPSWFSRNCMPPIIAKSLVMRTKLPKMKFGMRFII